MDDPRGLRTDGSRGDTKGCGIAQRYYQTSIVAGCDAPLDGKDKPQYGQIGHLAMVPAKAPFRTYAGRSSTLHGQSVRYGEKDEPRLKCSERSDLQAGSAPCTDPWTAVYHPGLTLFSSKKEGYGFISVHTQFHLFRQTLKATHGETYGLAQDLCCRSNGKSSHIMLISKRPFFLAVIYYLAFRIGISINATSNEHGVWSLVTCVYMLRFTTLSQKGISLVTRQSTSFLLSSLALLCSLLL
ncbi:hypothetical protein IGI04_040932 [Brassica rapa subsp. trilocularis]|uniref:Uncharacterized protein n=1 Tax=Brassica rapa subsp. trilocularis TaxID=1813537 RepID=A0ABQ7KQK6_BRACM|nr:hypothetical protein IGI04_040932 [Brassica rapa subsp. trilocularis]